jgi:hypothetical protein
MQCSMKLNLPFYTILLIFCDEVWKYLDSKFFMEVYVVETSLRGSFERGRKRVSVMFEKKCAHELCDTNKATNDMKIKEQKSSVRKKESVCVWEREELDLSKYSRELSAMRIVEVRK